MEKRSEKSECWLLSGIMLWAAALRFYRFWEIDFTHDELSALLRLRYDSFSELLQKAIYTDGHPAGVQTFLYYYTHLFGEAEWVVKLPFILMGLGAVYLIFRLGKLWGNPATGLLAASFVACSQYFVMYSQIARPYMAGCFFVLLAVLFWWKYLQSEKSFGRNFWLWVVSAAACAYIHHFALLAVALAGLSGIFFLKKGKWLPYLLSGVAIFILYLPHLPVFLVQLGKGGLEDWLGKPDLSFFSDLIAWAFHFSPWFALSVLFALLLGWIRPSGTPRFGVFATSLLWFMLTAAIGYAYSLLVAPLLQFSLLIFTFPFVLLFLFSGVSFRRKWTLPLMIFLILGSGTLSLIYNRDYYHIFYDSAYSKNLEEVSRQQQKHPNALIWLSGRKDVIDFYFQRMEVDTTQVRYLTDDSKMGELVAELDTTTATDLFISAIATAPPQLLVLGHHSFLFLKERKSYRNGEFYWFSKTGPGISNLVQNLSRIKEQSFDSAVEFGTVQDLDSTMIASLGPNDYLEIECVVKSQKPLEAQLTTAFFTADTLSYWSVTSLKDFYQKDGDYLAVHTVMLYLTDLSKVNRIRCATWNMAAENFEVESMKIRIRKGNPRLYGHFLPLKD